MSEKLLKEGKREEGHWEGRKEGRRDVRGGQPRYSFNGGDSGGRSGVQLARQPLGTSEVK